MISATFQIAAITRNTFLESIRQPIYIVMLGIGLGSVIIAPSLAAYTFEDDNKLMYDFGLSSILLAGVFLAAFTATGVLNREIENKTALTVISKPIARISFVLGKFLGVATALTLAAWIWAVAFLLTARHGVMETAADKHDAPVLLFGSIAIIVAAGVAIWGNFFYGWVFSSTLSRLLALLATIAYGLVLIISPDWTIQSPLTDIQVELLIAIFFVVQVLWILAAVAVTTSTRLGQVMTLLICLTVMFAGAIGDWLYALPLENPIGRALAVTFYIVTPNIQAFWVSDAITSDSLVYMIETEPLGVLSFVAMVSTYCIFYLIAVLALGVGLFQSREVS